MPTTRSAYAYANSTWCNTHNRGEVLMRSEMAEQAHDVVGCFRVEARHRLVGEQHLRALGERAGNRDALRLPARQGARALSGQRCETNRTQIIIGGPTFDSGQAAERRPQPAIAAEGA